MTSVDSAGDVGPACKATGFMTNDEYIAEAGNRHCFGGHDDIQLLSGRSTADNRSSGGWADSGGAGVAVAP